jgi:hypothetical protein
MHESKRIGLISYLATFHMGYPTAHRSPRVRSLSFSSERSERTGALLQPPLSTDRQKVPLMTYSATSPLEPGGTVTGRLRGVSDPSAST